MAKGQLIDATMGLIVANGASVTKSLTTTSFPISLRSGIDSA